MPIIRKFVATADDGALRHREIEILGAGDLVSANLLAASIVVHQLGTTGRASVAQLRQLGFE